MFVIKKLMLKIYNYFKFLNFVENTTFLFSLAPLKKCLIDLKKNNNH